MYAIKFLVSLLMLTSISCSADSPTLGSNPDPDPDPDPVEDIKLLLNEVCCTADSEWIEILNMSKIQADISGCRVVYENAESKKLTLGSIPEGTLLEPGAYYVFDKTKGSLSGSFVVSKAMSVHLVAADGTTRDTFDRDKQVGVTVIHPQSGSYARFPDTSGEWVITATQTKGAKNEYTKPPVVTINNGIWVRGEHFGTLNLQTLAGYGINNLFVNEVAITSMGETAFQKRVDEAAVANIKVHVWFQCFYKNGSWVNPINTSTKEFNQPYYDELIARAEKYARYGNIAGIHLDYIRYPGTAYKHGYSKEVNGENAITEFCRQISTAVKAIDPDIKLSAALMNEMSQNAYYYGQDTRKMSEFIDILIPMLYRYSWNGTATADKGEAWLTKSTKWFVDEIKAATHDAELWAGIMTYKPLAANDTKIENLSAVQLKIDCGLSLRNTTGVSGATGVVLFRYGIVNYFDMTSLYD